MQYTYEPQNISGETKDRMRLELGDTQVSGGANTCALGDEEIEALIEQAKGRPKPWLTARIACLKAIVMRFAMSVDLHASGMTLEFSDRYKRYKELLKEAETQQQVPTVNPAALGQGAADGGHYFYAGMHDNSQVK